VKIVLIYKGDLRFGGGGHFGDVVVSRKGHGQ
jgi:hypothetical protein